MVGRRWLSLLVVALVVVAGLRRRVAAVQGRREQLLPSRTVAPQPLGSGRPCAAKQPEADDNTRRNKCINRSTTDVSQTCERSVQNFDVKTEARS